MAHKNAIIRYSLMTVCPLPAFVAYWAWYPRRGGERGEMNRMKQGEGEKREREWEGARGRKEGSN